MKRLHFVLFLAVLSLFFQGCNLNDDGDEFHYTAMRITAADVPESFDLYSTYDITVSYVRPDNCTTFESFSVPPQQELTTREIFAVGLVTEKDNCQNTNDTLTASFRFEVIYDQPYLFRFFSGDDANGNPQYLEFEIPVNGGSGS